MGVGDQKPRSSGFLYAIGLKDGVEGGKGTSPGYLPVPNTLKLLLVIYFFHESIFSLSNI